MLVISCLHTFSANVLRIVEVLASIVFCVSTLYIQAR